jgi:hypothetical protein
MKTLKEYITESFNKRKYEFKIKVAGELQEDFESKLKTSLDKWGVDSVSKGSTTPIQSLPLDFPKLRNMEVHTFEVSLNYPTTQFELHEYITSTLQLGQDHLVVRKPNEPYEEYQSPVQERKQGALLDDPDYKELPKVKSDAFYGTKYNLNFIKEMSKEAKERAKEQGLKIPAGAKDPGPIYDSKDVGSTSPIGTTKNTLPNVKAASR